MGSLATGDAPPTVPLSDRRPNRVEGQKREGEEKEENGERGGSSTPSPGDATPEGKRERRPVGRRGEAHRWPSPTAQSGPDSHA